jgi:multidrug efflux system membrane fusion protein
VVLPGDAPRAPGAGGAGGGRRRQGASAPADGGSVRTAPQGGDPAASGAPTPVAAGSGDGPTAEQRQRFLGQVQDDPGQLARRRAFLAKIDQKDPAALERWHTMMDRRTQGGQGGSRPAAAQ